MYSVHDFFNHNSSLRSQYSIFIKVCFRNSAYKYYLVFFRVAKSVCEWTIAAVQR